MTSVGKRTIGRRKKDIAIRKRNQRFEKLYNIGQTITSEINMEALFGLVMEQANQVMDTERSALFLYDDYAEELWSLFATGMKKNEIRIKKTQAWQDGFLKTKNRSLSTTLIKIPDSIWMWIAAPGTERKIYFACRSSIVLKNALERSKF